MRTKFSAAIPIKRKRTKWHVEQPDPPSDPIPLKRIRTKFPPPRRIKIGYANGDGPVFKLSRSQCKALERIYKPPLSESEIIRKKGENNLRPDMSHMTPWDPSKRK
jgi:hypothetical protein